MDENNNFNEFIQEEPKPKKKKKKGTAIKVILIILLCCLVAGVLAVGGQTIFSRFQAGGIKGIINPSIIADDPEPKLEEEPVVIVTPSPDASKPEPKKEVEKDDSDNSDDDIIASNKNSGEILTCSELYDQVKDAMVSISTSISGYNAWGQKVQGVSSGSGFIVSEEGYILTNYHVVESSNAIKVVTFDDQSYDARMIGYNEAKDIAVLKIDGNQKFQAVVIGNSDKCKVGEEVVAIGNALGEFDFSMTRGIISGINRNVQVSSKHTMNLIQTDCTINSGNSGGALFNMKGEVIGITNAKYSSSGSSNSASIENIGFAIPINDVIKIVESIVSETGFKDPAIGVAVEALSDEIKNVTGVESGIYVRGVNEGSTAEAAGIKVGDIIVAADNEEINGVEELSKYIKSHNPGDVIKLTVIRQGKTVNIDVTVGEKENTDTVMGSDMEDEDSYGEDEYDEYKYGYGGNDYPYYRFPDIFSDIFGNYGY